MTGIAKLLERLILANIKRTIPATLEHQFVYRANRLNRVISIALQTALEHLAKPNTYVRMLFLDSRLVFNTVIPSRLVSKLHSLCLNSTLCNLTLTDLGTNRLPASRLGKHISATITLNTGGP